MTQKEEAKTTKIRRVAMNWKTCMHTMTTGYFTPLFLVILGSVAVLTLENNDPEKGCKNNKDQTCSDELEDRSPNAAQVLAEIKEIQYQCGELCELRTSKGIQNLEVLNVWNAARGNNSIAFKKKAFSCRAIWNISIPDEPSRFLRPPIEVPKLLEKYFSYNFTIPIEHYYFDNDVEAFRDESNGNRAWSSNGIREQQKLLDIEALSGGYGTDITKVIKHVLEEYTNVENNHFLVIGSQLPWIEVILLSLNVGHITTVEYNDYKTDHSKITILSPSQFREMVLSQSPPMFDGLVTFSSLEHSGLGRYGDQLNPWADIITMARAWCQMKPGARAVVGVPTGKDTICYNAHRIYGNIMYEHLFANWKLIYSNVDSRAFKLKLKCKDATYHPLHVLEK